MWTKFISRKFFMAVVAFVTVNVLPNLPTATQARLSALIAGAYVLAQGVDDASPALNTPAAPTPSAA